MEKNKGINYKEHLFALIVAGGGGTRLWPKSREDTPKQFLKLFNQKSLLEITFERLRKFLPVERIFISTASEVYGLRIKELLPEIPDDQIIVEPARRDTAAAHGLGAMYIFKRDKEAVIINAASDHLIHQEINYKKTMFAAAHEAFHSKCLIAVGIKPTYPHTGMGHLEKGVLIGSWEGRSIYKLNKFVEKPALELAKKYTESGNYYWNANHYVWRADSFLDALKKYAPDIYTNLEKIGNSIGTDQEKKDLQKYYSLAPSISVDYAVSEKADNFEMLIADYEWTDIGDWNEVWKNSSKDELGNVILDGDEPGGAVYNIDTSDALIQTDGKLIAVIDVDNIVIIDTKDALLVCSKSRSQDVKKIVNILKEENKVDLL